MSEGDEPNLTRQTLGGLQWSYAQTVVSAFLQIGVAAVLARVLDPVAFGLVALATLALRFVDQASRGGMAQAIIQKAQLDDRDLRTAFTLSTGLGLVFALLVVALAPLAGALFDSDEVVGVLRWMSLVLPITNAGAVADGLLRRCSTASRPAPLRPSAARSASSASSSSSRRSWTRWRSAASPASRRWASTTARTTWSSCRCRT